MFGFTVFWAYIAGFQYYLIWYGNLPEEIEWYLARSHGTWMNLSLLLVFGHFVIPFLILLFNKAKRVLSLMAILSVLVLFMHWIDLYWNVLPNLHKETIVFNWSDITIFLAHGGIFLSLFWRKLSERSQPVPTTLVRGQGQRGDGPPANPAFVVSPGNRLSTFPGFL